MTFAALLCIACPLMAQETVKSSVRTQSKYTVSGGITMVPSVHWSSSFISNDTYLDEDFNPTALTSYEGALAHNQLGLKLGINALVDNNLVGRLDRFMGWIGKNDYVLRVQKGKLRGHATWNTTLASNEVRDFDFSNDYNAVDLIKEFDEGAGYFGIGYVSLEMPVQVNTLWTDSDRANQHNGVSVYDPDYKMKIYAFLFGFDTMSADVKHKTADTKGKFGFFMSTQDKFGAGTGKISDAAVKSAVELNTGRTPVDPSLTVLYVDYDASMGVQWTKTGERASVGLGLGYNIGGSLFASIGGAADNSTELGYDSSFMLYRHGPMIKAYVAF